MEEIFEEALQSRDDKWGPTGYIENEIKSPSAIANTKRKYSDMSSSILRYNQGGDFLPDQSAEAEIIIMNEDEDNEDFLEKPRRGQSASRDKYMKDKYWRSTVIFIAMTWRIAIPTPL